MAFWAMPRVFLTYSKGFPYKKENHTLLNAIVAICNDGNALPALQCDDAGMVASRLEMEVRERAARERMRERDRKFRESFRTDGIIPR